MTFAIQRNPSLASPDNFICVFRCCDSILKYSLSSLAQLATCYSKFPISWTTQESSS